jgi:hypothetical protein
MVGEYIGYSRCDTAAWIIGEKLIAGHGVRKLARNVSLHSICKGG